MKRKVMVGLVALCAVCSAGASVVNIDFSTDPVNGPGPNMLPGVVGKTTTNVTWNMIGTTNQVLGLMDEDGYGTGAYFDFGTNSTVYFAGTATSGDDAAFFRTYAHLSGGGANAFTNDFTIGGIESGTADLVFYSTWDWVAAGSEFRVSGDGGSTWTDWTLCDGSTGVEDAPFSNGVSYIEFNDVAIDSGTILGEWCTTTNGASQAHRGPFNAVQIVASGYADALAPAFSASPFSMTASIAGQAYEDDLSKQLVSLGSQYFFTKLTGNSWLSVAADGTLSGTPTESDEGENTFTVQVEDDLGRTDIATMTIYVSAYVNEYVDTYDGDGIDVNTGKGGGLEYVATTSYTLAITDDSENLVFSQGLGSNLGAQHSGVHTTQKYPVPNGFTLDVVYNVEGVPGSLSESVGIGLIDGVADLPGLLYYPTMHEAIGISLTTRNGFQGLNHCTYTEGDADGVLTSLSTAQTISAGTNRTFNLTVEADGSFSYSIDGQTPTTGTTTFDLTKEYHFAIYSQRASTGLEIQSVSLIPKTLVNTVGEISVSTDGSTGGFSWYGQVGGSYELQFREDLTLEDWATITNIPGADATITINEDLDQPQGFYRVKLAE
jgi:hypothetical protein